MSFFDTISNYSNHDEFNSESPTECYKLKGIAIYLIILFISSMSINGLLAVVFIWFKSLRNPLNAFIFTLNILNLVGTVTELPLVITSNFSCR